MAAVTLEGAVAAHRAGRLEEAERGYRSVLDQGDPEERVEAHQFLGVLLHRQGRSQLALKHLDAALAADPDHGAAHANRGLVLVALGRPDEATEAFQRALTLRPDLPAPRLNLARLLATRGEGARAEELLMGLEHPDAWRLLGLLAGQRGDLERAWQAWSKAFGTTHDPGLGRALGQLALQRGRPADAVAPLATAYRAGAPVGPLLADALVQGARTDDEAVLAKLLADETVDAQRVERVVAATLGGRGVAETVRSPLLQPWLCHTIVQHPDRGSLPAWLTWARERGDVELVEALAVQAWLTEHGDTPMVDGPLPDGGLGVALRAVAEPPKEVPVQLARLRQVAVAEPARELELLDRVPQLTPIRDATSQDVAAMYEAHPYPRRVGVHRPSPTSLATRLRALGLEPPARRLQVLVAGAGTGQHPLQTATRYDDVDVLAIDLSRRSLARGMRVAEDHGIDGVRFAQADLLELELEQRFDVIESVGVLHHLADPVAGFRNLLRHLAPGGALRIGLYSERGRKDVVAARELVAEWGLQPDEAGLREARRRFLALPEEHVARIVVGSPDFPSSTGLRDLVFHPMEHRYDPPGLHRLLGELGLRFLGFQHNRPEPSRWYAERWPDDPQQRDLARWDSVEADHPRAFSGMFVFWCALDG